MKTGVVIQARYGATRLPGKVLLPLPFSSTQTVLEQVFTRCRNAPGVDTVIVATTDREKDDAVADECRRIGARVFRGDEMDVISRYTGAAEEFGLDVIVRVTADCPAIDPATVGRVITALKDTGADYASNVIVRTFPHGLDAEAFTRQALLRAEREAVRPDDREHVTACMYRAGSDYSTVNVACPDARLSRPDLRVTLDMPEDYTLFAAIYDHLGADFDLAALVGLFEEKPWLARINGHILQKKVYESTKDELEDAEALLDRQDMHRAREIIARLRGELA